MLELYSTFQRRSHICNDLISKLGALQLGSALHQPVEIVDDERIAELNNTTPLRKKYPSAKRPKRKIGSMDVVDFGRLEDFESLLSAYFAKMIDIKVRIHEKTHIHFAREPLRILRIHAGQCRTRHDDT